MIEDIKKEILFMIEHIDSDISCYAYEELEEGIFKILDKHKDIEKESIRENKELKTQYCERTDCVGRIGECQNHKLKVSEENNVELQDMLDKIRELCEAPIDNMSLDWQTKLILQILNKRKDRES